MCLACRACWLEGVPLGALRRLHLTHETGKFRIKGLAGTQVSRSRRSRLTRPVPAPARPVAVPAAPQGRLNRRSLLTRPAATLLPPPPTCCPAAASQALRRSPCGARARWESWPPRP